MKTFATVTIIWVLLSSPANAGTAIASDAAGFQALWDEWGEIYFKQDPAQRGQQLARLLPRVQAYGARHPDNAAPMVLEAVVLCSSAASDGGLGALKLVSQARDLLLKSIQIDPAARSAAAYITLGNLYYRLPGWPLSFGDKNRGRQYFKAAVQSSPDSIDANYFYGNALVGEGRYEEAVPFLEKAGRAPIRPDNRLSDLNVKGEIGEALRHARAKGAGEGDTDYFDRVVRSVLTKLATR